MVKIQGRGSDDGEGVMGWRYNTERGYNTERVKVQSCDVVLIVKIYDCEKTVPR